MTTLNPRSQNFFEPWVHSRVISKISEKIREKLKMGIIRPCFIFFMTSKRFRDPLDVRNNPKRSYHRTPMKSFFEFQKTISHQSRNRIWIFEYQRFYKFLDLNWVLSSHVTWWRCKIIFCYENHVINFALFQCETVVFSISGPFWIKNSFLWVTWLCDGILNYPRRTC